MTELFRKKGHSILTFKPGDIIIRLEPAKLFNTVENLNLGTTTQVQTGIDNSFRDPVEFIAIENNKIYLRGMRGVLKGIVCSCMLEMYSEDWAEFVIPPGLTIEDR